MPEDQIPAAICIGWRPRNNEGGSPRTIQSQMLSKALWSKFEHVSVSTDEGTIDAPFNRARAKNLAAKSAIAMGARTLVFADADCYARPEVIRAAVEAVQRTEVGICMAHNGQGRYMSSGLLEGMNTGGVVGPFPGGIFAIRAETFMGIGGFDERFLGWGHEDFCFFLTADAIFNISISGMQEAEPFTKMDILYGRSRYEDWLRANPDTPEGMLYQQNTERRDLYLQLNPGDTKGYWALRNDKKEEA